MENLDQAKHNDQNKPYSLFFSHVFFMTSLEPDMSSFILLSVSHPWRECHPTLLLLLLLWLPVLFFTFITSFSHPLNMVTYPGSNFGSHNLLLWILISNTHIKNLHHTYIPYNHTPKTNHFTQVPPSNPRKSWHSHHHIVLSFLWG